MSPRKALAGFAMILSTSVPAVAGSGTAVPEPSTLLLFGLGVAGLIIGRSGGRPRRD